MRKIDFTLYDMGLRLYHPPVLMDNRKYVALVEELCDIYPTQKRESDAFEFTLSPSQSVKVSPAQISIGDLFGEDPGGTIKRIFHVLGRVLDTMDVEKVEAFDHMVSARLRPTGEAVKGTFEDYPAHLYLEKSFLKEVDFKPLSVEGDKPHPSVSWVFDRGDDVVNLKLEPFPEDRDLVFVELSFQHPDSNISLGDIRAGVEDDLKYLRTQVLDFLGHAFEPDAR